MRDTELYHIHRLRMYDRLSAIFIILWSIAMAVTFIILCIAPPGSAAREAYAAIPLAAHLVCDSMADWHAEELWKLKTDNNKHNNTRDD